MSAIGDLEGVWAVRFLNNSVPAAHNSALFQEVSMRPALDMPESRGEELLS